MNRIVGREGIAINGRRFNHPDLQSHLYEVVDVKAVNEHQVSISFDSQFICIANAQNAIEINDVVAKEGDRVLIIGGVAKGNFGFISFIDDCEYLIIADKDDDYPHGYQRYQFIVLDKDYVSAV